MDGGNGTSEMTGASCDFKIAGGGAFPSGLIHPGMPLLTCRMCCPLRLFDLPAPLTLGVNRSNRNHTTPCTSMVVYLSCNS